ncbi:MAG: Uma2 family endonuclease [Gloeocapsa sp. DLM2.Bin57]|nr:MAG: Uma2 family endonuclease [Gloeocapsa sp. DLM2.Bin57]
MITLKLEPLLQLHSETFSQIVALNPDTQLELTATGDLLIISPRGGETGDRNDQISFQLRLWNKQTKLGKTFNAATGFSLPNGGIRSPDASWLNISSWEALTPNLCPDFLVELRSPSDNLGDLRNKMQEYINNGARLGWLIDPINKIVEIYHPQRSTVVMVNPGELSREEVLPGFVLDLENIL